MEEITLRIAGMSCAGCVNSVRNALERLPGVRVRQVEIGRDAGIQPYGQHARVDPVHHHQGRVRAARWITSSPASVCRYQQGIPGAAHRDA
jgi:copper chaperone CopZ